MCYIFSGAARHLMPRNFWLCLLEYPLPKRHIRLRVFWCKASLLTSRYGADARPRKRRRSGSCFANARTHEFFALGEASTGHGAMLCEAIFSSASTSQNLNQSALSLASLEMDAPRADTKFHESFARHLCEHFRHVQLRRKYTSWSGS